MPGKISKYATWPAVNAADRKRMDDEDRSALQAERDADAFEAECYAEADRQHAKDLREGNISGPPSLSMVQTSIDFDFPADE